MLKTEIPYPSDSEASSLFKLVRDLPWSVWLDSGTSESRYSRYDIIVAEPRVTLQTSGNQTLITSVEGGVEQSEAEPFELLRHYLQPHACAGDDSVPFSGGALGYFSYDLARRLESLPERAVADLDLPEMAMGIYDWALVCDRVEQRCWLTSSIYQDEKSPSWQRLVSLFSSAESADDSEEVSMRATGAVVSNMSERDYTDSFVRIQHYLEEGDCYQVNFAQRFSVDVCGSAWSGYKQMRQYSSGPFSAYMNLPSGQILCTSPERFLRLKDDHVETRPIKGTRPRDADETQDEQLRENLRTSGKDRAENLMIVDLLRNDLGKSCRTGTVQVPELFSVESFSTVHHLVSTITCELDEQSDALTLLRGCFPGGSITGAPKLRAMEIIEELEPHRRGIYCGSIGYIGYNGNMDTNIAIRTAVHLNGKLYYSAGGGIVRDSSCEAEYQESFDKAAAFIRCFSPTKDD